MYRNDTVPKTVDTRRPCEGGLECATIVYTSQCTVHPYAMGHVLKSLERQFYASEPMSVQNSIQQSEISLLYSQ